MGCSSSIQQSFFIYLLEPTPSEIKKKLKLNLLSKEAFQLENGKNLIEYMKTSKSLDFINFLNDKTVNSESIFHFVFDDNTICVAEFEDAKGFLPKDKYSYYKKGNTSIVLSSLYIIPTFKLERFRLNKKEFYSKIETMVNPIGVELDEGKSDDVVEQTEEINNSSSFSDESSEKKQENLENHKENLDIKSMNINDNDLLTEYDSDSENSIDDDCDLSNSESLVCNGCIINDDLEKINMILKEESMNKSKLTEISIVFNKFKEKDLVLLGQIMNRIKFKDKDNEEDEGKTSQSTQVKSVPYYLKSLNFHDNIIEFNTFQGVWGSINDFLITKRTFPSRISKKIHIENRKFQVLRALNLSMNKINDLGLRNIIRSIRNIRLHLLDLSSNDFVKTSHLSQWILKNKSLKSLFLQYNPIEKASIDSLLSSIKVHKSILELNLSYINLSEKGKLIGQLYSRTESSLSSIKTLILKECSLKISDVTFIFEAAVLKKSSLEYLDLSANNKEGNKEYNSILIGFISNCPLLTSLIISNNKIDDYSLILIEMTKKAFQRTSLSLINISDDCVNYFSLLTDMISYISEISSKVNRDFEFVAVNNKGLNSEERILLKDFLMYETKVKVHFE